jgi:hypothetical protein
MANSSWGRWDRLMQVSHLYTGLFLVPWMTLYAISALCLNHSDLLRNPPQWKVTSETNFKAGKAFPRTGDEQADTILSHLGLSGPRRITQDDAGQMVIYRLCATGDYRVTWQRKTARLTVERQLPLSAYTFINALHFQHRYDQPYFAHQAWALIVDLTAISTVIWVISGVYLWARRPRRWWGGWCLVAGTALFIYLAVLLCR